MPGISKGYFKQHRMIKIREEKIRLTQHLAFMPLCLHEYLTQKTEALTRSIKSIWIMNQLVLSQF